MGLKDEIDTQVSKYLKSQYEVSDGYSIPEKSDVAFGARAKKLKHAVVLYADLRGSKKIVAEHSPLTAVRAHKAFLYAASKCIRAQDGKLRSFNGDSVMAFFSGENAAIRAVKAAMKTKAAVLKIVNPMLKEEGIPSLDFGIGVAQGEILVAKSGIPGNELHQDLIWIGWPTYHAFQYGDKARSPKNIWISKNIYNTIKNDDSMIKSDGDNMWVYNDDHEFSFGKVRVYKTSHYWNL
jgi:adenylate cyclase